MMDIHETTIASCISDLDLDLQEFDDLDSTSVTFDLKNIGNRF